MLNRKLFRELRLNGSQFITIFLMVMIAALAFSGVHAYMDGMADSADRYYRDFNLEDLWLTGENFSREDLETVKQVPNVKNAERVLAFQCTWIREEGNITIETNFIESNEISRMYVFEGEAFDPDQSGLWLDYYLARSLGIKPGDEIPLTYGGYTFTEKVNGLVGTPDHVYVVKDSSVIFTNHTDFGFAYLSEKEFPAEFMYDQILESDEMKEILDQSASISLAWTIAKAAGQSSGEFLSGMSSIFGGGEEEEETSFDLDKVDLDTALGLVNVIRDGSASADQKEQFLKALDPEFRISDYYVFPQIIVDAEDPEQLAQTREDLQNACSRIMAVTDRGQSVSWSAYQSEVEEGQTYSVIFMAMFLFIAILSVVTTMNRFIKKQRTSIGTLKALGFRKNRIIRHYVAFGLVTGFFAVVIGIVAGVFSIGIFFLREEMDMFLVPEYSISVHPVIFMMGFVILAMITLVTYLSCRKILQEPAAQALRTERPKVKVRSSAGNSAGLLRNASFFRKFYCEIVFVDVNRHSTTRLD